MNLALVCILAFFLYLKKTQLVLEFNLLSYFNIQFNLMFYLDNHSLLFSWTVILIFSLVVLYSFEYMANEIYLYRFLIILTMFGLSMVTLILSSNLFTSLIGWDGLGVTSMFLIIYYYSRSAYKASMVTFLMNRVGDCFFILMLTNIFLSLKDLSSFSSYSNTLLSSLIILTSLTKSAQIPFSTWLPMAMEAPTPVSALVHSSTLVTAGIYLLYRYNYLWSQSDMKHFLTLIALSTCFMASMAAMVEMDLKKLIALSTLSQLGFITFSLSLLQYNQSFMHLIMHAYFKALLFMGAGYIIHSHKGSQDLYKLQLNKTQSPTLMNVMSVSVLSMMGLPYLSGFYSKDLILDSLKMESWVISLSVLLILSFVFTTLYSVRMVWYLQNSSNEWNEMSDSHPKMIKPMLPLTILAAVAGSMFSWLNFNNEMFVNSSKVLMMITLYVGGLTYWTLSKIKSWEFLESKWYLSSLFHLTSIKFFDIMIKYKNSADMSGLPGIYNKLFWTYLEKLSKLLLNTNFFYLGNSALSLLIGLLIMSVLWL